MKLRSYQTELNIPTEDFLFNSDARRAQVYAPTGAGKTVCFIEIIKKAFDAGMYNIVVLHPRIALSQDQLKRFNKEFSESVHFTSFHSGEHIIGSNGILNKSYSQINTTNAEKLKEIIDRSHSSIGKPHITFSSYHSFYKLLDIQFDLIICDEAHYLVQDRFSEYLPLMQAKKILFYTATPISAEMEENSGMRNYDLFGNVIAKIEPKVLIKDGYIVAPLIHQLECVTDKDSDRANAVDVIVRSYIEQYKEIIGNGMPFHQMLVACRDVAIDIEETILNNVYEIRKQISEKSNGAINIDDLDIYAVTSACTYKNGKIPMKSRDAAIEEVQKSNRNVIIVHYDTLSEGIDIDTLSGVVMMRDMSKAKIIQTIGRASRPYKGDLCPVTHEPLKDLFDLNAGIDLRKKPRSIITFPVIDGSWMANENGKKVAEAFILAGYDALTTYMPMVDQKPTGKTGEFKEDHETFSSQIVTHELHRVYENLFEVFKKEFEFQV